MGNVSVDGSHIEISATEITTIYNHLQEIVHSFENEVKNNSQYVLESRYYEEGKAKRVIEEYNQILNKTMEIHDHYMRMMSLIAYTINSMMATDEKLAKDILQNIHIEV